MAYLAEAGELYDANGMASTQLAAAVGYPGSSVAFAQLLSGMERSGLIAREVRGKRTYRIGPGTARAAGPGVTARAPGLGGTLAGGPGRGPWPGRPVPGAPGWPGSTTTSWPGGCWCRWSGGWRPSRRRARRTVRSGRDAGRSGSSRSGRPAGDGQRPGVRAGHGVDQARQAGRGERPAARAAQGRAAVAGAGRRAGPPAASQRGPERQRGRRAAAAAHLGAGRGQCGRLQRGGAQPARLRRAGRPGPRGR